MEVVRSGVEPVVPRVGDVVTARVVRINPRLAAGGLVRSCLLCCPVCRALSHSGQPCMRTRCRRGQQGGCLPRCRGCGGSSWQRGRRTGTAGRSRHRPVEQCGGSLLGLQPPWGRVALEGRAPHACPRHACPAPPVDILCVGPKPVRQRYSGVIRVQDVRATEIDKVQVQSSFRPGDVVRAEVLSLGDARSYHLTTAKNHLGVVHARSVAGGRRGPPRGHAPLPLHSAAGWAPDEGHGWPAEAGFAGRRSARTPGARASAEAPGRLGAVHRQLGVAV